MLRGMMFMILISACLAGIPCKYSGGDNGIAEIRKMYEEGKCIAVCPEVLGGLPTPRPCAEIQQGRVINTEGRDVSEEYRRGALLALQKAEEAGCAEAILKAYSPSCGCGEIYDGSFTHTKIKGNGVFAKICLEHGIHCISDEEYKERKR
jgi:uncharacterized protein YbbK (DUF523 family)